MQYLNKEQGCDVPLVLMNSFNTHDDTDVILQKYSHANVTIETFNQSRYPRIFKDSLTPMPKNVKDGLQCWYPPGHGDLFGSLYNSGVLQKLLDQGKEYLFVSNVDNLAATVEFNILQHMEESGAEFIMEVTNKTLADVKGGTLIDYGGRVKLLELAQVPSEKVEEFKSIKKFKIFNTNNIWINLAAIKRVVEHGDLKNIDVIPNGKTVDGKAVLQLETAVGAAIQFFNKAHGVNVPRTRFLPVKSTSDLLVLQSDLYQLLRGTLTMNPARPFPTVPVVKLGPEFSKVDSYYKRIKGIPNMLELDQLTVQGDVNFGDQCVLKGTVIIVAQQGSRIDIPPGSILENKVVTGNLFILDH
jgi:UTP--glucose-1-phosphate uridylyltransferase